MNELPVLDRARLDALAMGDASIVRELVELLLTDAEPLVASLGASVAARERDAVREQAHGLKGIAANVGAARTQRAAAELEVAARDGGAWHEIERLLAETAATIEEVRAAPLG